MTIAWVHALGRMFAEELERTDFEILDEQPYWNHEGIMGHSYYGYCHGRRFCLSQSQQSEPDSKIRLARILSAKKATAKIETKVGPFYRNRKDQIGLIVAARDGTQWVQMISPGTPDQPLKDRFTDWIARVRCDRTFDPQILFFGDGDDGHGVTKSPYGADLHELEDILRSLRGRKDFEW